MLWRRRYYHRFTLAELEIRREKRALIVQRALRLFAIVLALCLTMLLSLVCFKPWKDLRSLEHERSFRLIWKNQGSRWNRQKTNLSGSHRIPTTLK